MERIKAEREMAEPVVEEAVVEGEVPKEGEAPKAGDKPEAR